MINPIFFAHKTIDRLRLSHDAAHLNIPAWMYKNWTDSIVQAVSECDSKYTDELGEAWRECLKDAVDYMISDNKKS